MSRKLKAVIYIYILVMICLAVIIYAVPSVTGMLTPTVVLPYGNLTETDEATCYFVRSEKVYLAEASGTINYYFEDRTKVRRNSTILTVTRRSIQPEGESEFAKIITRLGSEAVTKSDYKSDFNGIISYSIDGYEGYFTPETILDLNYDDVKNLDIEKPVNLTRKTAYRDEPLYKICDNDKWYITCWVSAGNSVKYQKGREVRFQLPLGELRATVTEIAEEGEMWQIVFETDRSYGDFTTLRSEKAEIITSDYSGIIVPNRSIATVDGQVGVYVKQRTGDYTFTPIKIIASDGENSAVSSSYFYDEEGQRVNSVNIYDEILKNPE